MIHLNKINDSILDKHWKYFKNSKGYKNLMSFSMDLKIPVGERRWYEILLRREAFLKSIIIGNPNEILKTIDLFNTRVATQVVHFKLLSEFGLLKSWDEIYQNINEKAKQLSASNVIIYKTTILKELSSIDQKIKSLDLEEDLISSIDFLTFPNHKLTIKLIKNYYFKIRSVLNEKVKKSFDRLIDIFNYDKFIKGHNDWGAYNLTKELGINVCPYCNRNYVHTLKTAKGKTRPELDHYFPKSRFPFLALSIFNMIPSCHICNSNLKGSKDFYTENHMHPYLDDFNDSFHFKIEYLGKGITLPIISDLDKFNIKIEITSDDKDVIEKITNSNSTFKIEELYNFHKDVAKELVQKSIYYNKTRLDELNNFKDKDGRELFESSKEVSRFVIGNYINTDELGQRTLAKFTRDLILKTELNKLL